MSKENISEQLSNCILQNINWEELPLQLRQVLHNNQHDYHKYIFNYSLKNQLRYRGSLVAKVFWNEQRYYQLLVRTNINTLSLFPYHLADILTKGLRITPFNYYIDVLCQMLNNDRNYDQLPNFTAADCLRVLGIGRNEYLAIVGDMKTTHLRTPFFGNKPNPIDFLPRFPARIQLEPWWLVKLGYILEKDILYCTQDERQLIDDLIELEGVVAGKCNYELVHSLYRKGLIYLDIPITGDKRICIPPLRNFVMNRIAGDNFEKLLYKLFFTADEHMNVAELAQILQVDLLTVKHAVSLFCRLGFARLKDNLLHNLQLTQYHKSWLKFYDEKQQLEDKLPQLAQAGILSYTAISDDSPSDNSISEISTPSPQQQQYKEQQLQHTKLELLYEISNTSITRTLLSSSSIEDDEKKNYGLRVGFLFDSTLTAFLMMGNLSPGLKSHAVTMFEVGKLSEESMDAFLMELEKVSLSDAEGEGDVCRYFTHAVILRSTICNLRHMASGGLDLLRLECLEGLDYKTRDRLMAKKYKFIISFAPLSVHLSQLFRIPFFGQFYCSNDCTNMWTKLYYYHITGYGPPTLFLRRGYILKALPRIFLGYGKLLVNIQQYNSFVINSENFSQLNIHLKNGCILLQGYGIKSPGKLHYESFPFNNVNDNCKEKWIQHKAVKRLAQTLDLNCNCGYITFLNTGVPDIGSETYNQPIHLIHKTRQPHKTKSLNNNNNNSNNNNNNKIKCQNVASINSPTESITPGSIEITSFTMLNMDLEEIKIPNEQSLNNDAEDWTILDVNFGVPLFDIDCNTRICEQIKQSLGKDENLSQLPKKAADMRTAFNHFVHQCLHYEHEDNDEYSADGLHQTPFPRFNLAFDNGRITNWHDS